MTQSGDHKAGRKHRSTNKFLEHFKKEVMEMVNGKGSIRLICFLCSGKSD